jgi:hypothetical protein
MYESQPGEYKVEKYAGVIHKYSGGTIDKHREDY